MDISEVEMLEILSVGCNVPSQCLKLDIGENFFVMVAFTNDVSSVPV